MEVRVASLLLWGFFQVLLKSYAAGAKGTASWLMESEKPGSNPSA